MRLLLCSDFSGVGYKYLNRFYDSGEGLNVLFVGYACECDDEMYISGAKDRFVDFGCNIIDLVPDYDFKEKIDIVFVRGGNTTKLIHYLKKYNQFEKVKELALGGALYIGNSAGSVLAGSDTEWTLEAEPYAVNLKKLYGEDALRGYGFVDKMVLVHASKYRMCRDYEREIDEPLFKTLDTDCYPAYLRDIRKYKKDEYIKLANNEVLIISDNFCKKEKFNWSFLPVKII